jgi:hypothetical protein
MKQLASVLAMLAAMAALLACGESHLVEESDQPTLGQHIFVLPDRYAGQPYNYDSPASTVYLDTNQPVKFWATYSLDGQFISTDVDEDLYLNHNWTIDGEYYNISPLRFKFSTPGFRQGILETVDLLNDTLRDTVNIYVNTPVSIGIIAPANGFNRVNPGLNSSVKLHWSIEGVDPWESSACYVHAAYDKDNVWRNNLGKVDCNEGTTLNGNFLGDSLTRYIMDHPESDTSVSIYWGIRAIVSTEDGFEERDSSDIYQFSTLYMHSDSATISIPVVYDNLRNSKIHTRLLVTNSAGDTLDYQDTKTSPTTFTSRIAAQTGVHIHVYDLSKTEFEPKDTVISTSAGAKTIVDTIHMQDRVQPQVALLHSAIAFNDSMAFYALDDGSGINPNRIHVVVDSDTVEFNYDEPFIKFKSRCFIECTIRVSVEDNAHNTSPKVFWETRTSQGFLDSLFIDGPFTDLSGER